MINIGFDTTSLLGIVDTALGILYFVLSLIAANRPGTNYQRRSLLVTQAILAPLVLLPVGFIFSSQGWRMDPILQFSVWWLHLLIIFLGIKDFFLAQNE